MTQRTHQQQQPAPAPNPPARWLPEHDPESLRQWLAQRREPWAKPFRAKQLLRHYFVRHTPSYAAMTDLPKEMRETLAEALPLNPVRVVEERSDEEGSVKLVFAPGAKEDAAANGSLIECVVMHDAQRDSRTVCVSSQVGCAMGCQFCASGLGGLVRNLTTGEILGQIWHAARFLRAFGFGERPITNIVFMGVGEPLANVKHVAGALKALTAEWGFGLSPRRITVSTVGLVAGIDKLRELEIPVNLALSLHAADDETRQRIIPTRPGSSPHEPDESRASAEVERIMQAGDRYFAATGREVTLEFILLPKVNDHQAAALAELIQRHPQGRYNVNVIPYNRVPEFRWREPKGYEVARFLDELRSRGINAHARKRMAYRVSGACGQLRLTLQRA